MYVISPSKFFRQIPISKSFPIPNVCGLLNPDISLDCTIDCVDISSILMAIGSRSVIIDRAYENDLSTI